MSSPLVFVRDGRTLPFIPVTTAAMDAIRRHTPKRRPYAIATYMALLEFANENRADRVAVTQRELVERTGASRSTVQTALVDLAAAGVLNVVEQRHGSARIENEYVVVEPPEPSATSDTPARETSDPRPSHRQLPQEVRQEEQPSLEDNSRETDLSLVEQLKDQGSGQGRVTELSPVVLWGKKVPPDVVRDAMRALAYFCESTGQRAKPFTGRGKATDELRLICRAMQDHPEVRTVWKRMIDRAVADPWWTDVPPPGVVFSPKMVQRSIARVHGHAQPRGPIRGAGNLLRALDAAGRIGA